MVIPARAAKLYERTWDRFNEMMSFTDNDAAVALSGLPRQLLRYAGMDGAHTSGMQKS